MREKIVLEFNPDTMTVADLKKAAETLRMIMKNFDAHKDGPVKIAEERLWQVVAMAADKYEVN